MDFKYAIERLGRDVIEARYGNLFQMYEKITDDNPYEVPMKIYPAVHYTMGGVWVDYELQSTIPGLFVAGEANFSDHGANRLGASALMQGLADGYFVLPYTIQNYLAYEFDKPRLNPNNEEEFKAAKKETEELLTKLKAINGNTSVDTIHRKLGKVMWNKVGMARTAEGLKEAIAEIQEIRKQFWSDVKIPGELNTINVELEKAVRLADFLEIGELMARDALEREESCGGHFRLEHKTPEGEAKRDDENFMYVAAWEFKGVDAEPVLHKEPLHYEEIEVKQRNYKTA